MRRWSIAAQGAVLVLVSMLGVSAGDELHSAGWREDFHSQPVGWELRTKTGANVTEFSIEPPGDGHDGALRMSAVNASGMLATHLKHVDLHRTPVLRWRWRALTLPTGGDGRIPGRDDQAIAIYVSSGGLIRQKSVAYRWETDTPVGTEGDTSYAAGIVQAKWTVLRNAKDAGSFFVEERNLAHDFQRAFGFVPDDVSIGVTSNSQYTGTTALAELDWIELVPEPRTGADETEEP